MNGLETFKLESRNLVDHVKGSFESRLNLFENEKLPAIADQIHEVIATQFDLFKEIGKSGAQRIAHPAERYKPATAHQWHASLDRAKREFHSVYPLWKERLDATLQAFRKTKVGNAAWAGDVYSRVFRGF